MQTQTEYPAVRHTNQTHEILKLLLLNGSLTHAECEDATKDLPCGKCTTLRSRIPELRLKYWWPIVSKPESHGNGSHARYFVQYAALAQMASCPVENIKKGTLEFLNRVMRWRYLVR